MNTNESWPKAMERSELVVAFQGGRWTVAVTDESLGIFEFFHSREGALQRAIRWVREQPFRRAQVTEPDGSSWTLI